MPTPQAQTSGPIKIVAAMLEGKRIKGFTLDFSALRDKCRVFPSANAPASQSQEIDLREAKAVFFVQEFEGLQGREAQPATPSHGRKIEVIFLDGERLEGTTEGYNPQKLGFFMVPIDPSGNILRAFIINANVKRVRWL